MALPKKTTPVDDLNKQRSDLVRRLVDAQGIMQNADPVKDWERVSKATADVMALERAITEIDKRIKAAEAELRRATAEEREQAQAERKAQAQARMMTLAQRMAGELLTAPWICEFDEAQQELAQAGEWLPPQAAPLLRVRQSIVVALEQWRSLAPTWVGLPEPPSRDEQALAEHERAVARAEKLLADMRKQRVNSRHGGPTPSHELLLTFAHGLAGAKAGLLRFTEPDLTPHEVTVKANSGIPELAGWLGEYWERYNEAQRKAQREEQARASMLV